MTGIEILKTALKDHFEKVPLKISTTYDTFFEIEEQAGSHTGLMKDLVNGEAGGIGIVYTDCQLPIKVTVWTWC